LTGADKSRRDAFRPTALARIDAAEPLDLPVEFTTPRLAPALLGVVLLVIGIGLVAAL
jgi:hypothetical protein